MMLRSLQRRIPFASMQLRRINMLQHLGSNTMRQNPLDQAVRFRERVAALRKIESRVVFLDGLGCDRSI
jgi:hypothetical protein